MRMRRLAIRGVLWNWGTKALLTAIAFVLAPIVVHGLGTEAYGIWAIIQSLTNYLAIIGMRGAGTKYLAQYEAMNDRLAVSKVAMTSVVANTLIGVVAFAAALGLAAVFPAVFDLGSQSAWAVRWVVILVGLNFTVRFVGQTFAAHLIALNRFDLHNAIVLGVTALQAAAMVVVIRLGGGLVHLASVVLAVETLQQCINFAVCSRLVGGFSPALSQFDRTMFRDLFNFSFLNLFITMSKRVTAYAGGAIIGLAQGPTMAAYYVIGEGLLSKADSFRSGITAVLFPIASRLDAQQKRDTLVRVSLLASRILLALGLLFVAVFVIMGRRLIGLWMGAEFVPYTYPVLAVLTLAYIVKMSRDGLYSILMGMGRMGFLGRLAVVEGLATLALGAWMTFWFGLLGMAWASVAVQLLIASIALPLYAKRVGLLENRYLLRVALPAAISAVPALGLALAFERWLAATHLLVLLGEMAVVALVAAGGAWVVCIDAEMRIEIRRALWSRGEKKQSVSAESVPDGALAE